MTCDAVDKCDTNSDAFYVLSVASSIFLLEFSGWECMGLSSSRSIAGFVEAKVEQNKSFVYCLRLAYFNTR